MNPPNMSTWKDFLSPREEEKKDPYEDFLERSEILAEKLWLETLKIYQYFQILI